MQIHATSPNPSECALFLWKNGQRARKMITETQQILACVQYKHGVQPIRKTDMTPFRTPLSIRNHPVTLWAGLNKLNVSWAIRYLTCLYSLYEGNGFFNVSDNINLLKSEFVITEVPPVYFLNFAKSDGKGIDYTHMTDVFKAYKSYLNMQDYGVEAPHH